MAYRNGWGVGLQRREEFRPPIEFRPRPEFRPYPDRGWGGVNFGVVINGGGFGSGASPEERDDKDYAKIEEHSQKAIAALAGNDPHWAKKSEKALEEVRKENGNIAIRAMEAMEGRRFSGDEKKQRLATLQNTVPNPDALPNTPEGNALRNTVLTDRDLTRMNGLMASDLSPEAKKQQLAANFDALRENASRGIQTAGQQPVVHVAPLNHAPAQMQPFPPRPVVVNQPTPQPPTPALIPRYRENESVKALQPTVHAYNGDNIVPGYTYDQKQREQPFQKYFDSSETPTPTPFPQDTQQQPPKVDVSPVTPVAAVAPPVSLKPTPSVATPKPQPKVVDTSHSNTPSATPVTKPPVAKQENGSFMPAQQLAKATEWAQNASEDVYGSKVNQYMGDGDSAKFDADSAKYKAAMAAEAAKGIDPAVIAQNTTLLAAVNLNKAVEANKKQDNEQTRTQLNAAFQEMGRYEALKPLSPGREGGIEKALDRSRWATANAANNNDSITKVDSARAAVVSEYLDPKEVAKHPELVAAITLAKSTQAASQDPNNRDLANKRDGDLAYLGKLAPVAELKDAEKESNYASWYALESMKAKAAGNNDLANEYANRAKAHASQTEAAASWNPEGASKNTMISNAVDLDRANKANDPAAVDKAFAALAHEKAQMEAKNLSAESARLSALAMKSTNDDEKDALANQAKAAAHQVATLAPYLNENDRKDNNIMSALVLNGKVEEQKKAGYKDEAANKAVDQAFGNLARLAPAGAVSNEQVSSTNKEVSANHMPVPHLENASTISGQTSRQDATRVVSSRGTVPVPPLQQEAQLRNADFVANRQSHAAAPSQHLNGVQQAGHAAQSAKQNVDVINAMVQNSTNTSSQSLAA